MADTTNSFLKWPFAVSCFAAQRTLGVLPLGNSEPLRAIQESLYEAGEAAKKDFRTNTLLFGSFQFEDKVQSALTDFMSDAMSLKVLKPSYMTDAMSALMKGSAEAYSSVATADARDLLVEQFRNTGDVLGFVNDVDAPSKLSADGTYPLEEHVEKFYARGDYPTLWLIEGLGERYAHAHLSADGDVHDLLTSGKGGELADKTQLMMHAGMGIAFAKHLVDDLTPWSSEEKIKDALRRFLELVRQNSIPGYEGAALESLGLVTQTWYGQLVTSISDQLAALDADAGEFFWHGAGRAMYFSPMYMLPGLSPWDAAEDVPPDEIARRNARAGIAWAFTIVNVRQPRIAANFLQHKSDRVDDNDAYSNGVYSTLIMAGDMYPGHKFVSEFCQHKPDPTEPDLVRAWDKHIGRDAGEKVDEYRRTLKAHRQLGEVFRYHDLPEFVNS